VYAACNAYALWPAALYNTYPRYLKIGMIFEKKVIEDKERVSFFSTTFV
jgi:hypothetical protein